MRIDSAIITGSFSVNGDTFNDLGSYSTTGSNAFTGSQNITGSIVVSGSFNLNDSATNFSIQGNTFSQTYLNSNGAIVLNPGYGGVEMVGSYRELRLNDIYANGFVSGEIRANNGVVSGSSQIDITSTTGYSTFSSSNASIDSTQNTKLTNLENKTGSLATTGSNIFYGNQTISGTVYIQSDLIVQGSSCIQNITGSSLNIGTNIVSLNTATPSVRYAGMTVQDSGSSAGVTGSILWDSLCNRWMYSNPSTVGYSGGIIMSGPRAATLGTETTLTCNYVAKSGGGDHLYDSCIWEMSGSMGINTSSPAVSLHVDASGGGIIRATRLGSGAGYIQLEADGTNGTLTSSNGLLVNTGGSQRVNITQTGIACFSCQICTPLIVAPTVRAAYIGNDNVDGNSAVCFGAGASDNTRTTVVIKDSWNGTNNNNAYITLNVGTGSGKVEALKVCSGGNIGVTCSLFGYNNMRPADNGYGGIDFYNSGKGYAYAAKIYTFKGPSEYYGLTTDYGNATAQFSIVSCGSGTNNISFFTGTSNTERMVIGSTGLVGIGVICASYNLHVKGSSTVEMGIETTASDNASRLRLVNGKRSFFITNNAADDLLSMWYDGNNRLQFNTSNQWFGTGCLGVNTSSPSVQLHVNGLIWATKVGGTNSTPAFQVRGSGGGPRIQTYGLDADTRAWMGLGTDMAGNPYEHSVYFSAPDTGPYGRVTFGAYDGTTYSLKMTIARDGSIGAPSGTNIYNPSDCRLKTNISPITQGLNQIMCLNPVKFNWIDGYVNEEKDKTMLGFLAQEMNEVLPEVVEEFSDGTPIKVGDDEIYNPLRVNEKFIIPVLVKAIQELKAEIEELKNK